MDTTARRESAKILRFPARKWVGGAKATGSSNAGNPEALTPCLAFGGGWYHEAAIQEADRSRKN